MGSDRNALCECGSGKKYKVCCAVARPRSSHRWAIAALILFAAAALWGIYGVGKRAVTADGGSGPGTVAARPPGPAPPGKEWSYDHGHWHDISAGGVPQPEGPPPPGKVWSPEHGHWHDIGGGEPAQADFFPQPEPVDVLPEDAVSYSE